MKPGQPAQIKLEYTGHSTMLLTGIGMWSGQMIRLVSAIPDQDTVGISSRRWRR